MKSKNLIITLFVFLQISSLLLAGGSITGSVKFDGKTPKMKAIRMGADPICNAKHEVPARTEWFVAGPNGEMQNVFVYIKEGLDGKEYPAPETPVTIDQNGCVYKPHILGMRVGQPLEILNSDGTLHNVHALPKEKGNKEFNEAMPGARKRITKTFNTSEVMVKIKCDVHPWMGAYIGVLDHPCFSVTDDSGKYTLDDLPPGTYTVEAWHEKIPAQTATVTIEGDESVTLDFIFKKPEKSKK